MRNPKPYFWMMALCLTLCLQGCRLSPHLEKEEPPQEPTAQLTIAYTEDSLLYLPLYVAINQDFFQKENLIINLQRTNSQEAVEGLRTGQYDLMLNGAEIGFYVYQQEHEDKLVFIGQTAIKNGSFLLARKNEETFTWSAVKGKVIISTASGDTSTIILENILRQHRLRPFLDVHLINNLPPLLRPGTFSGGTAHFILTTEPTATILEKEEAGQVVASLDEQLQVNVPTVFITTKSQLKENQELYQRFITALQQGLSWVNQHSPEEIATVAQSFFPEQEEKILLRGICRYKNLGCWPETPLLTGKELLPLQQLLLDAQELNSPLPLHELLAPLS
ncbi:MAG: ABC transporter substrate-binding protein [Clostridia bacterium]|nr:ABC transporter substrate-binding protein [Clostridia bacterium]